MVNVPNQHDPGSALVHNSLVEKFPFDESFESKNRKLVVHVRSATVAVPWLEQGCNITPRFRLCIPKLAWDRNFVTTNHHHHHHRRHHHHRAG